MGGQVCHIQSHSPCLCHFYSLSLFIYFYFIYVCFILLYFLYMKMIFYLQNFFIHTKPVSLGTMQQICLIHMCKAVYMLECSYA